MEIKNPSSHFSTSLETSMFRYIFAVIAASSIYALTIYAVLTNHTPMDYCIAANCIGFGITK